MQHDDEINLPIKDIIYAIPRILSLIFIDLFFILNIFRLTYGLND